MAFPEADRVVYRKHPLVGVTCQLRFPAILRIDSELPAGFQDRIRDRYPLFQEAPGLNAGQPTSLGAGNLNIKFGIGGRSYTFLSPDRQWTISLTRDFLALTTQKYEGWEDFKENFHTAFEALVEVYRPHNFIRVGLRYQNVIRRSSLGLSETRWSDLFNAQIAGVLASPEIEQDVQFTFGQFMADISGSQSHVQINHGFVTSPPSQEVCYLLDNDFFTTENNDTETSHVNGVLDRFNQQARNIFHWCISERLHRAMEPQPVPF